MKKFILSLLFGITILFSTSSCVTGAYAQDVVISGSNGDVDVSVVVRYGTPYYFEGSILYYLYDGWYYYPYLHNNYYYYYRYSRPLPSPRPGHRFVPRYNDRPHFKHHRDYRPTRRSSTYATEHHSNGHKPNVGHRPNTNPPRGNVGRPSTPNRGNSTIGRPSTPSRSGGSMSRPTPQIRGGSSTHGGGAQHGGGHFGGRR